MMSENLQLRFVKSKRSTGEDMAMLEEDSRERWKRIIKYLLNIDIGDNSEQMKQMKLTYK